MITHPIQSKYLLNEQVARIDIHGIAGQWFIVREILPCINAEGVAVKYRVIPQGHNDLPADVVEGAELMNMEELTKAHIVLTHLQFHMSEAPLRGRPLKYSQLICKDLETAADLLAVMSKSPTAKEVK